MKLVELISIGLFTIACVLSMYYWSDKMRNVQTTEGFETNVLSDKTIQSLIKANEPVPTDADANAAYQTLLRYIRNDFSKGIRFVRDFGTRFFGDNTPLRADLDVRTLMDNYSSPL